MRQDKNLKFLTFSFDDGVTQDRRLVKLLDKYGFKATFNLNSALLGNNNTLEINGKTISHNKVSESEVKDLYLNHEVAAHTLHHPDLKALSQKDVIFEVDEDRKRLETLCGKKVIGMAYPGGGINYNDSVKLAVNLTGIKYTRTYYSTYSFDLPKDWLEWAPSIWALDDKIEEMADEFILLKPDRPQVMYVWGHAYEFDVEDTWERFESLLKKLANKADIKNVTNGEIYNMFKTK